MKDALSANKIEFVMVPKNMTHLLQPLDLTTNASFKKFEKREFTEYFTSCIMKALQIEPDRDVASIEVDLNRRKSLKRLAMLKSWWNFMNIYKLKLAKRLSWQDGKLQV